MKITTVAIVKGFVTGLAGLATVVGLFYAVEDFRGARAWQAERERLTQKGEELSWARLVPEERRPLFGSREPVSIVDWKDPALLDVAGFERGFGSSVGVNWRLDLAHWRGMLSPPQEAPAAETPCESGQAFFNATAALEPTIRHLVDAARSGPIAHWDIRLDGPPTSIQLPPLLPFRRLTNLLRIRIASHFACGDARRAVDEMRVISRMVVSLKELPFMITFLVRMSLEEALQSTLQDALSRGEMSAATGREAAALLTPDWFVGARDSLRAQRNWVIYYAEADPLPPGSDELGVRLMPHGWLLRQAVEASRFTEGALSLLPNPARIDPRAVDALTRVNDPGAYAARRFTPYNFIARMSQLGAGRMVRTAAALQTRLLLLRTGLALADYRARKGEYPAALADLLPKDLSAVPTDIVNGEPLHYQKMDRGFVLYSVGWDLKDDGGREGRAKIFSERPDWALSTESEAATGRS